MKIFLCFFIEICSVYGLLTTNMPESWSTKDTQNYDQQLLIMFYWNFSVFMFNLYCTDVYELQEENIYIDTSSLEILKYLSGPLEKKNVGTLWQMNTYYRTYVIM